ncbi:MAG: bifunctional 3,4-dihydroxy-2-butanone-4-phosphate synthase/GTP cyclohydrolase II [Actinomycetota bacterium]
MRSKLSSINNAIEALQRGEIVIVVDDPGRENEGDFVMAAERVTPEAVNFMVTHGRGLVCLPMTGERLDALGARAMVPNSNSTAFTLSIDLAEPRNTGISAYDRARCIRRAVELDATADEFVMPGHVFPLRAREGGVLERPGHTEAAVDLARLAGLSPAGVICEILNEDGTMARMPDLEKIAEKHNMPLITIEDLIEYRRHNEVSVKRVAQGRIPTAYGEFTAFGYEGDGEEHIAFVYGDPQPGSLVRVHSECLTGDVFGSLRCDCGAQLREAMRMIALEGAGAVVYLKGHEGRGIGINHKLRAYTLQDAGADTVEANEALGFPADMRDYAVGAHILRDLSLDRVRLLTNNPSKRAGLEMYGIEVMDRVPIETIPTLENLRYLQTKRDRLDHELTLELLSASYR